MTAEIPSHEITLALRRLGRWIVCDWDEKWRPVRPLRLGWRDKVRRWFNG